MADVPEGATDQPHGLSIAQLLAAVENELIPRLLAQHSAKIDALPGASRPDESPPTGDWASDAHVAHVAALAAEGDMTALRERVSDLISRGVGLDALYLHLFAAAARHLGDLWTRDEISFVDVQLGLSALQNMVCECGPFGFRHERSGVRRSILLSVAPGDQHTFGVTLAAEFFRRNGWQVSNLCGLETRFLLERLASTHYTAVGFSLHNENCYDALAETIRMARRRSRNRALLILVGGDYFARRPAAVAAVGADLGAEDAHKAVLAAEHALDDEPVGA